MNIINNPAFLLFIEPIGPASEPILDAYTMKMIGALRNAISGTSNYGSVQSGKEAWFQPGGGYRTINRGVDRGFHLCFCGCAGISSNCDYLIPTTENIFVHHGQIGPMHAVITNALCVHYVACHRDEIPIEVLVQIMLLKGDSVEPTEKELKQIFSPKK